MSKINHSNNPFEFGTAEKKLLFVFFYYVLLSVVAITSFALGTRNASPFVKNIQRYFFCEQSGHDPNNPCSRSEFEKLSNPSITTLSYILLAIFPVINLVFVVNIQELKQSWRRLLKKKGITNDPGTGSSVAMTSTLKRGQY